MKADISLAERRRIEREQQAEIRAMLAPRHFATMQEQMAIDAALAWLEFEHLQRVAPAVNTMLADMGHGPVPVVIPYAEPTPPSAPEPLPVRTGAPDPPFYMRQRLGLH